MIWSRLNFHGLKPPFYSYIRILSLLREIGMRRAREDGGKEGWGRDREIDRRRGFGPVFIPNFPKTRDGPL